MDMFCLPRECLVCHKRNIKSLESCQKCAASFCKNHKDGIEHKDICVQLNYVFVYKFIIYRRGKQSSVPTSLQHFPQQLRNIQTDSEMCNARSCMALNSDYLTHSLTLFYAMRLLCPKRCPKSIVVHVLGASTSEKFRLIGWEILPRLIGTEVSVVVILIGPKLTCKLRPFHDCDNCMSRRKKCLTFEFHGVLYENPVIRKTGLGCGIYNLYIYEHELGSSEEMWAPSIQMIAKQNCLFILTSATPHAFKKETDRINTILNKEVDHLYSGKNPFASLMPYRTIGIEYVFYINQYESLFVTDMRNLSYRYKLKAVFYAERFLRMFGILAKYSISSEISLKPDKNCSEISPHWTIDRGNAVIGNTPKISTMHSVAKSNDSPEFPSFHNVALSGFMLLAAMSRY
ncbi:hypothetical protein DBV15_07702 [Temnothorax longispinosus]|uniref:Mitochondrial splicing suppressor 51-like C-terminal domain-containing protein n=1 Tax=Temnothorax longispinosus TaxID=300112 RepID=A0A4S2KRS5_9HYME|nr:hypothetical protein DBV15_07702 [Temnothorax longispinosus]